MNSPRVLGEQSPAQFLAEYWQKQPLLVRGVWPEFHDPLTPEELAGLACEDSVESQLTLEDGNNGPLGEVRQGPFAEADFLDLPETHWSLRVRDVEKHAPDLTALLEPFRFLPDWRIDGLTIHCATLAGAVGPQREEGDLFIWQGQGRQRWQISAQPWEPDDDQSGSEFAPEQEWVLEPGDLLYLPPGVSRYGVALEPCLSYEIACRAPSHRELLSGFLEFLLDDVDPGARYADPDLSAAEHPGEISPAALNQVRTLLRSVVALDDETLAVWLGCFLSQPKPGFQAEPEEEPYDETELREHVRDGGTLERNPGSRFYYSAEPEGEMLLFVDGQEFALGPDVAFMGPLLCQHRTLTAALLRAALKHADARQLLLDLLNEGFLVIYDESG